MAAEITEVEIIGATVNADGHFYLTVTLAEEDRAAADKIWKSLEDIGSALRDIAEAIGGREE